MPYQLAGRNVLVTGGSRGLGEVISRKFAQEKANVSINYLSSAAKAQELADHLAREFGIKAVAVQGNTGIEADCIKMVNKTIQAFGGLDVIISNAGWTRFSEFADLSATTDEDWDLCYAVNVKAQLYLMRAAESTLKANADGGAFVMTSSIAGAAPQGSSMPYSVSKAAQLHLMRCLAKTQAPKIRVNAVLPGILLTEWGMKFSPETIAELKETALLKKETDLEDCAQAFVDAARNSSMTGQRIQVDSGLVKV